MLILPREWEGLHPAFPKPEKQLYFHSPVVQANLLAGTFGGIFGVAWFVASRISKRIPRGGLLRGIGLIYPPIAVFSLLSNELERKAVIDDVRAILQADGIAMPPRRLFKRTSSLSLDDKSLITGGVFAAVTVLLATRAPFSQKIGYQSVIGAFGAGGYAVALRSLLRPTATGLEEARQAREIWKAKTGKEPPKWLYYDIEAFEWDTDIIVGPGNLVMDPLVPSGGKFLDVMPEDGIPEEVPLTPPGTDPHKSGLGKDGSTKYIYPMRDYEWNPTSATDALEKLEAHLRELNQERTIYAQEAEYLWHTIARREAKGYPIVREGLETAELNKERRMLELLTSIHKQMYEEIANLDWCISNTQKMVLQVRSEGKWRPSGHIPESFYPKGLLNLIRGHQMKLEDIVANHPAMMDAVNAPEDVRNETRREFTANLAATTELLEDLEAQAKKKDG